MAAATVSVWRRDPVSGWLCQAELPRGSTGRDLVAASVPDTSRCDFYVTSNGRRLGGDEVLQDGLVYSVVPRLCGGKGGFGSMLRALGAQIEKTTNREACRDLSGRRLRDVNHEKAMAEWITKQAEREAEKGQRRLERLKRKLEEPKHYFTDPEYHQQCSEMSERLEDAVIRGLQASSSSVVSPESSDCHKRKHESQGDKGKSKKQKFLWTGLEGLEVSSSSSDSDSDSDSESPSTSASCQSTERRPYSSESDSDGPAACSSSTTTIEQRPHSSASDSDGPAQCSSSAISTEQRPRSSESDCDGAAPTPSSSTITKEQRLHSTQSNSDGAAPCSSSAIDTEERSHGCERECDGPTSSSSATTATEPNPELAEIREPGEGTTDHEHPVSISGQTEHMEVTTEPEKLVAVPELPQDSPCRDASLFNLLSFSSAAELEALGLEKLKTELAALGLKCGGTLQERTARLFSVRGLSREQIDPSLFPKPAKAKKK